MPACLQPAGFVGTSCPELLVNALRQRFDATGSPRRLGLIFAASAGNSDKRGAAPAAAVGDSGASCCHWRSMLCMSAALLPTSPPLAPDPLLPLLLLLLLQAWSSWRLRG